MSVSASVLRGLGKTSGKLAGRGYSDVILAFAVVTIISLMIFPLPLLLIDILVAVNILIGIGLLLLAIYIPSVLAFSSFPSVLLITTLFRLSLSIATTRMILLKADAGDIIHTFGNLVVGGSLVVGIVVFLIITVVQFIVVAKGAERVAEVAARFTLDAMPGKQLSIDSDLRSGLIDKDEARRRRKTLETESQLHGAMDGAMKFVKGDAIAGIIIIIVNLLGGLAIGVLQLGMSLGDAMHTYSVLTIGDGLVSQIPALLSAMSAGLIVTRTGGADSTQNLGQAIAGQISSQPRVMLIGGLVALVMMLVPGFPKFVFLLIGLALLGGALWQMRETIGFMRTFLKIEGTPSEKLKLGQDEKDTALALPPPLSLDVGAGIVEDYGIDPLRVMTVQLCRRVAEDYGVPIPRPVTRRVAHLPPDDYQMVVHGMRVASGSLRRDRSFRPTLIPPPAGTGDTDSSGESAKHTAPEFIPAMPGEWLSRDEVGNDDMLDGMEILEEHLRRSLESQLNLFIGIQETSNLVTQMSRDYPDLVREMLRVMSPQRVADVLKRLVEERVPIRNLRDVFEAITDAGSREKDIVMLTELTRIALRRQISDRHVGPNRTLRVLLVHPELEDRLRQSVRVGSSGSQIALEPELVQRVLQQLQQRRSDGSLEGAVLLCSLDVRRHVRKLTESDFAELSVLSLQELVSDINLVPIGQVNV